MKKQLVVIAIAGVMVAGASTTRGQNYAPDNSGKNVRDRDPAAVTAGDQTNDKTDMLITQQIRKAVVADKALSTNAHNVKIVTMGGVVTLRGPVKSAHERARIEEKAKHVVGVTRVDNQLEIASK